MHTKWVHPIAVMVGSRMDQDVLVVNSVGPPQSCTDCTQGGSTRAVLVVNRVGPTRAVLVVNMVGPTRAVLVVNRVGQPQSCSGWKQDRSPSSL